MIYPTLPVGKSSRESVDYFRGYNHNLRIGAGEFYDMKNMTSDNYPLLSPRGRRGFHVKPASPQGLIAKDRICYVDGSTFVMGEEVIEMNLSTAEADCPKQLVSMGAFVIVMPDKKYINTLKPDDHGDIEAYYTSAGDVTFSLCTISGDSYENVTISPTEPSDPKNLDYWLDTSVTPNALKQYSGTSKMWVSVASTYIKIASAGIGKPFSQYDGVTISGVISEKLKDLNASIVVQAKADDYIVVAGLLNEVITQTAAQGAVKVERRMPVMDFVIESGNRLWGCRYGSNISGEVVNEIYASKLGDFKNWNCFMGFSTDSYAASCGTDGNFTGAVAMLGTPLFFKEGCVHKVFGNFPANFQIQDTSCRGVQSGCHGSLAIVNETLFYKARSGIVAFDGSVPTDASAALGNEVYTDAVGGAHGNKYYVSMKGKDGNWNLFVYDTIRGLWHKEDDLHASAFCEHQGELYCIDASNRNIITMLGSGEIDDKPVEWMVQTGEIGINSPDMKYISRITLRMAADVGTIINIYAQYDQNEEWEHLCNIRSMTLRSISVPIRARRCDFMRLRIEGIGPAKIYSYTKTISQGSELS